MKPRGVILAGGQARRIGGGDKGRLEISGISLFHHVIERLSGHVNGIVINANGDKTRFNDLSYEVVSDSIEGFAGPLAGVLAGLDHAAANGVDTIVTVAADTPFYPRDLVSRLRDAVEDMEAPLALAATRGEGGKKWMHPTFGLWPVALRDDLRMHIQDGGRKVLGWTDRHMCRDVVFESGDFDPFFNINTAEDLEKAKQRVEQSR